MELAGAAAAMVIGRIGTTAVRFYYLLNGDLINTRHLARRFVASSKRILHIAFPAMATQLIGPVTAAIITRMLASHGEVVVAGFGVAVRIEAVAVMLLFALSGSIGPFVGQNWGGASSRAGGRQHGRDRNGRVLSCRGAVELRVVGNAHDEFRFVQRVRQAHSIHRALVYPYVSGLCSARLVAR